MKRAMRCVAVGLVAIVAIFLAYGCLVAYKDYKDDPKWCAMLGEDFRLRKLNPLSAAGYQLYLRWFTDVEQIRTGIQGKLLDGTYARQAAERLQGNGNPYDKFQEQVVHAMSEARCELSNQVAAAKCGRLEGLSGFKFGAKLPRDARVYHTDGRPEASFGESYIVSGYTIEDPPIKLNSSPSNKLWEKIRLGDTYTVVDVTPGEELIYKIETVFRRPNGSVEDYVRQLRRKWPNAEVCGPRFKFQNAQLGVATGAIYAWGMGISIVAVDHEVENRARARVRKEAETKHAAGLADDIKSL